MKTSAQNRNKSDLSDKYTVEKKNILTYSSSSFSDPLALFHKLSSKCINPNNPINATPPAPPAPPIPATAPTFTPAEERFLADFYCSRPRPERLAMHNRSLYLRAEAGWPWDTCDTQAQREAYEAAGKPDNFKMATDTLANSICQQKQKEARP